MSLSVLSQASALNPGADLWIVPDLDKSQWTAKLDWYLNFQVCKSSRHTSKAISSYLDGVITETELPRHEFMSDSSTWPLMISSSELLPNKWVVLVPWNGHLQKWTEEVHKVWKNLQQPSLRIFLPSGQTSGSLQLAWQKLSANQDFTVVVE